LITFVAVAAAVFFFVVKPINAMAAARARGQGDADPTTKQCTEWPVGHPGRRHALRFLRAATDRHRCNRLSNPGRKAWSHPVPNQHAPTHGRGWLWSLWVWSLWVRS